VVITNKVKIFVNAFGRKNFVKTIKSLGANWMYEFTTTDSIPYKAYLIFGVVANIFILTGFFAFIIVVVSDVILLSKLIKQ
jgi:hypothetical protein